MNNRLLNANMEDKFKTSFRAVIVGFVVVTVLAMLNIIMLNTISKSLSNAIVAPIGELKSAVGKIKSGDFDVEISYSGQDELGDLGKDLKEACEHMHIVISDAGYLLGEMADGRFDVTTKAEK